MFCWGEVVCFDLVLERVRGGILEQVKQACNFISTFGKCVFVCSVDEMLCIVSGSWQPRFEYMVSAELVRFPPGTLNLELSEQRSRNGYNSFTVWQGRC